MISDKDVKKIASLSRIHLRQDEIDHLTKNLESILDYMNKLEKLDITKVEPTSHIFPLKNVHREDVVKPSLGQKDALKFAVDQHKGSFKVPKIIE